MCPGPRLPVGHGIAELDQPCVDLALQQELRILLAAVVVHAAAGMTAGLVAEVEVVVLGVKGQRADVRREIDVSLARTTLGAIGSVLRDRYANRHAGTASVAIRAVGEDSAAAKPHFDQFAVDIGVDQVRRRGHLRTRLSVFEVTAGVGRRCIELQRREREFLEIRHVSPPVVRTPSPAARSAGAGTAPSRWASPCTALRTCEQNWCRAISRPPSEARCLVFCWQSITGTCSDSRIRTRAASASFEASGARANIDSPKNIRPRLTPYSPPTSCPSIQVSTECASPRACSAP